MLNMVILSSYYRLSVLFDRHENRMAVGSNLFLVMLGVHTCRINSTLQQIQKIKIAIVFLFCESAVW